MSKHARFARIPTGGAGGDKKQRPEGEAAQVPTAPCTFLSEVSGGRTPCRRVPCAVSRGLPTPGGLPEWRCVLQPVFYYKFRTGPRTGL